MWIVPEAGQGQSQTKRLHWFDNGGGRASACHRFFLFEEKISDTTTRCAKCELNLRRREQKDVGH